MKYTMVARISKIRIPPSPYVGAQEYKTSSVYRTKTIPTSIGYATSSTATVASSSSRAISHVQHTSTTNVLQPLFVGCKVFSKDDEIEIEAMRTIRQTLSFEESDNDDDSSIMSFGSRVSSNSSSTGSMMFTARRRFQLGRTVERWGGGEQRKSGNLGQL